MLKIREEDLSVSVAVSWRRPPTRKSQNENEKLVPCMIYILIYVVLTMSNDYYMLTLPCSGIVDA